jgi:hypothetical protein
LHSIVVFVVVAIDDEIVSVFGNMGKVLEEFLIGSVAENIIAESALHRLPLPVLGLIVELFVELLVGVIRQYVESKLVSAQDLLHEPPLFGKGRKRIKIRVEHFVSGEGVCSSGVEVPEGLLPLLFCHEYHKEQNSAKKHGV